MDDGAGETDNLSDQPSAIGPQPSAVGDQPSAVGDQASAISDRPSAISHQPSATSHQPSAIGPLAVGVDLVEVRRIEALVVRYGERFTARVFTPGELAACGARAESLAARWAAKEAVAKALGTGIGAVAWQEIEVLQGGSGCPGLRLHGDARLAADARGLTRWALSLAHDGGMALAFVVAT